MTMHQINLYYLGKRMEILRVQKVIEKESILMQRSSLQYIRSSRLTEIAISEGRLQ